MKKGIIILAIVGIIALWILNKVQTARQLEFNVGVPRNISLQTGQLTFDLPLTSINVTSGNINIRSADFDIYSNTVLVGKAIIAEPVTIRGSTQTEMIAKVQIGYFQLLQAVPTIINLFKGGKISLKLDGLVYAELFQVPIVQTFDFDAKQIL